MNSRLFLFLFIGSVFTFIYIIKKIINNKMQIRDSVNWIIWTFFMIVICLFPNIISFLSKILGIKEDSNTVFLIIITYLYIISFLNSCKLSKQSEKIKELTQELALFQKE